MAEAWQHLKKPIERKVDLIEKAGVGSKWGDPELSPEEEDQIGTYIEVEARKVANEEVNAHRKEMFKFLQRHREQVSDEIDGHLKKMGLTEKREVKFSK